MNIVTRNVSMSLRDPLHIWYLADIQNCGKCKLFAGPRELLRAIQGRAGLRCAGVFSLVTVSVFLLCCVVSDLQKGKVVACDPTYLVVACDPTYLFG